MGDMIPPFSYRGESIRYRLPGRLVTGFLWAALSLRPRSFAGDARRAVAELRPPLQVLGKENIPARGPCLVTCNHYSRPGFAAWWVALAITAAVADRRAHDADGEIHWVMTAAWTFRESPWRHRLLTPLSRWAFQRVAKVYGFVPMPPMPPDPREIEARALAVRRTIRLARRLARQGGILALAPEGMDTAGGLGHPPEGAGRFVALLVETGMAVLPVGVAESAGRLCASFGPLFVPRIPSLRAGRDRAVTQQVMGAIDCQLSALARHVGGPPADRE
jgi:1-acyl-sn-glycerol-3-phosphate acyltransferase